MKIPLDYTIETGEGKISIESPLGKAMLGAKVRDKVTVKAPDGEILFTIKAID